MPTFIHIAPDSAAQRIRRSGIAPSKHRGYIEGHDRLVWAFPRLPSFSLSHQWMRELKRLGARTLVAVDFRLPDDETVLARHYQQPPVAMTAAQAVALIRSAPDPRGYEVIVPRRVSVGEITAIRSLPRAVGWRYYPDAKSADRRPCDCPCCAPRGEVKARRYRERIALLAARWDRKRIAP